MSIHLCWGSNLRLIFTLFVYIWLQRVKLFEVHYRHHWMGKCVSLVFFGFSLNLEKNNPWSAWSLNQQYHVPQITRFYDLFIKARALVKDLTAVDLLMRKNEGLYKLPRPWPFLWRQSQSCHQSVTCVTVQMTQVITTVLGIWGYVFA